jgi:hypothetical protein
VQAGGANELLISGRFLVLEFLHSCITREIGSPLRRNQHTGSAYCLCGLLKQVNPGVKLDLIKDESFSRDEPNRATNQQRPKRE